MGDCIPTRTVLKERAKPLKRNGGDRASYYWNTFTETRTAREQKIQTTQSRLDEQKVDRELISCSKGTLTKISMEEA